VLVFPSHCIDERVAIARQYAAFPNTGSHDGCGPGRALEVFRADEVLAGLMSRS
jgi:hypothetical protein